MTKLWERMKSWLVDRRLNPAVVRLKANFPAFSSAALKNMLAAHFDAENGGSDDELKFQAELRRAEARTAAKLRELLQIREHRKPWPSATDYLNFCLGCLDSAFPLMQRPYLRRKLEAKVEQEQGIWAVWEYFLEKKELNYPKTNRRLPLAHDELFRSPKYIDACTSKLLGEFPQLWASEIQSVLVENNCNYVKCRRELAQMVATRSAGWFDWVPAIGRSGGKNKHFPELAADIRELQSDRDRRAALRINEEEYEAAGQLIECQCCFGDFPFERLHQCADGHLFCASCMRRMVGELVGNNSTKPLVCFSCTEGECGAPISSETVRVALADDTDNADNAGGNDAGSGGGSAGGSNSSAKRSKKDDGDDENDADAAAPAAGDQRLFDAYWRLVQQRELGGAGAGAGAGAAAARRLRIALVRCPFCDQQQQELPQASGRSSAGLLRLVRFIRFYAPIVVVWGLPSCLLLLPIFNLLRLLMGQPPIDISFSDTLRSLFIAAGLSLTADWLLQRPNQQALPAWAQRLLGVDGSSRPFGSCVRCTNPECQVLWCTECLGEAHTGPCTTGIPIKGDLDSLRRYVEAEMAVALVRRCPSCARQFHKADGCNKMTCPCGAKMCYLCRAPVDDYSHFCTHFRAVPGQPCTECNKCDLWRSNDDSRHIKAAGRAAKERFLQRHPKLRTKAAAVHKYGPYTL